MLDAEAVEEVLTGTSREDQVTRLHALRGAEVRAIVLEGQRGEAEVVAVGALRGITVVTRHRLERDSGPVDVLLFHGRLDRPGTDITVGARLAPRAVLGYVGGEPPTLELQARELREPLVAPPTLLSDLESLALGFAVDPRNVLPLSR